MTTRKQPPMFHVGGISGAIFCVTRWTDHGNNRYTAKEQFDVTDEVLEAVRLYKKWKRAASKEGQ